MYKDPDVHGELENSEAATAALLPFWIEKVSALVWLGTNTANQSTGLVRLLLLAGERTMAQEGEALLATSNGPPGKEVEAQDVGDKQDR